MQRNNIAHSPGTDLSHNLSIAAARSELTLLPIDVAFTLAYFAYFAYFASPPDAIGHAHGDGPR